MQADLCVCEALISCLLDGPVIRHSQQHREIQSNNKHIQGDPSVKGILTESGHVSTNRFANGLWPIPACALKPHTSRRHLDVGKTVNVFLDPGDFFGSLDEAVVFRDCLTESMSTYHWLAHYLGRLLTRSNHLSRK